jgi:hypothetical protein
MKKHPKPSLEVADVFRSHGDRYRQTRPVSPPQLKVMYHIENCRTAAMGGHADICDACGHAQISYNSCRDRHCPKCQSLKKAEWLEARMERLLPVEYFHVVFTIPDQLNPLALQNKKLVYDILFRAAAETMKTIATDKKHLGAQIGFTAILHTWGRNLLFHPHLHLVVTGGGLTEGGKWKNAKRKFLLPVKVLAKMFRGKFLAFLNEAFREGKLELAGSAAHLSDPRAFGKFKDGLYRKNWVVYAKRPFGGAEHVFRYLGRYTHRVAIANHRLIDMKQGKVRFHWRDHRDGNQKIMTLDAQEFIRRFLLHELPAGFVRIRHFGLMAGRNVHTKLALCKRLLEPDTANESESDGRTKRIKTWIEIMVEVCGVDPMACPVCGARMRRRELPVHYAIEPDPFITYADSA